MWGLSTKEEKTMGKFLLQQDGHARMYPLAAMVYDIAASENSFMGKGIHQVLFCSIDKLNYIKDIEDYTPIGSINFVEKVLRRTLRTRLGPGKPLALVDAINQYHIKPINVPDELLDYEFTQRRVFPNVPVEELASCFEYRPELFIKSATQCKAESDFYTIKRLPIRANESYFVSDVVHNIMSEWRCFVMNGQVLDVRRYVGGPWSQMPSKNFVEKAVRAYTNAPSAYTMDIAVTDVGANLIIECHNFVACGLYGFESPRVLAMFQRGYAREVDIATEILTKI